MLHAASEGCTGDTRRTQRQVLLKFERAGVPWPPEPLDIARYFTGLDQQMKPVSVHKHYRHLRSFFRWCVAAGLLDEDPMRGITRKKPKTLPVVPTDDAVDSLLRVAGRGRERILVGLLADAMLRVREAARVRVEDVNLVTRTISVVQGKGQKDGVAYFGAELAAWLRDYTKGMAGEDFLISTSTGRPLDRTYCTKLLHRLSRRAGLPRIIGAHALRHYGATALARRTGDVELVRQALRHESLSMALRYIHLSGADVAAKFRRASPLDNLRAGR